MSLKIYPIECGWLTTDSGNMCEGTQGKVKFPVSAWFIEHPKGNVLFDAGMHGDLVESTDRLGPMAQVFDVDMSQTLGKAIESQQCRPDKIDYLVISHLHFDHCAGWESIPNAKIIIQRAEWEAGRNEKNIELGVYAPNNYEFALDVEQVDGLYDIFGDGTVVCVPTPGHTAGHQSLKVQLDSGPVLLTADCCYWENMLSQGLTPPFGFDKTIQLASMELLKKEQAAGVKLYFGHDNAQWQALGSNPLS